MRLISELWKDIGVYKGVDYTGMYEISSKGRFRSLSRTIIDKRGYKYFYKGKEMIPFPNTFGYMKVTICKNGKVHEARINCLVAIAFIPNPNNLPQVNHIDENKSNNDVNNLEWCTAKENCNHGTHNERVGIGHRKAIVQLNLNGDFIREWKCIKDVEQAGFIKDAVSMCACGKRKTSSGYIWLFKDKYDNLTKDELQSIISWVNDKKFPIKIVQLNNDGKVIKVWDSANSIYKSGISIKKVTRCLNGELETYMDSKWIYLSDYERLNPDY